MLFKLTAIILFLHCCHIHAGITGGLRVTLSLFSGRHNPKWSVTANAPMYGKITQLLNAAKKTRVAYSLAAMPARPGFRGFIVQEMMKTMVIVGRETTELQQLLLKTMPRHLLREGNYKKVLQEINTGTVKAQAVGGRRKRYAPDYDPAPWSAGDVVQLCNNCYNYANIVMTGNFAEPGLGSGQRYQSYTNQEIENAAIRDGLVRLDPQPDPSPVASDPVPGPPGDDRHLVALAVDPDRPSENFEGDFHWYRLDSDKKWSHKPGDGPVTRVDDDGNEITDPRKANWGDYKFVSFMTSDRNNVKIHDVNNPDDVCWMRSLKGI